MRLVVVVPAENFDRVSAEPVLLGRLAEVEIRQGDGLLSTVRQVAHVEVLGGVVAEKLGLAEGAGPAIRAYTVREENG
jgi:hypothetical protein